MSYGAKYYRKPRHRRINGTVLRAFILLLAVVLLAVTVGFFLGGAGTGGDEITFSGPVDSIPPVIQGVEDILLYEGSTVSYRAGVTVTDDTDENPELTVDSSGVDLTKAGSYEVIYTATDAAGNTARVAAAVTVLERKNHYQELDTIYQAADALLGEILTEDMTAKQQVRAIYRWARLNITYSGHSDRADWRQTAYTVLQEKTGDCYGYFAVTKLLFDRLQIPNIDVRKVKNFPEDSDHFWSLVSVDGGKSYYHFDATPRVGEGDDFCLVTDAFLDSYSAENKNSHNRDKSLYPQTPEEK